MQADGHDIPTMGSLCAKNAYVLKKIFWSKRDQLCGELRAIHNETDPLALIGHRGYNGFGTKQEIRTEF
jgi:hypothetical protein